MIWEDMDARERARMRYEYRNPKRGRGKSKPGRHASKFFAADFIAIDGEGWDVGEVEYTTIKRPSNRREVYSSREHHYTMLAASTGAEIVSEPGRRLETKQCLDFLCDVSRNHPRPSLLVVFSGSYDVNHILMYGLTADQLRVLVSNNNDTPLILTYKPSGDVYKLKYRPRKSLTITRNDEPTVTLWDVWGFFQGSFIEVIAKWLGKDHRHYAEIEYMKSKRQQFGPDDAPRIAEYNRKELDCLVELMNKVRDAVRVLDLTLARWDGAGAVATAMYSRHDVKKCKQECPPDVYHASCYAYSGGHIEVFQRGHYTGRVYHYDLNSAYPSAIALLPDLCHGRWERAEALRDGAPFFTLVHCSFEFSNGCNFYPLFFRRDNGAILYPRTGEGWYWLPEIRVAQEFAAQYGGTIFIHEVLSFYEQSADARPFAFVRDYYKQRQDYIDQIHSPDDAWKSGAEKIIKLGLNSLYGKMAQQVGSRNGKPPPYFQIEWAGFVTSYTRAQMMRAAIQNMPAIISIATDGIFSTEPLDLDCPVKKELGKWEFKTHGGMTVVAAGIYWLHEENQKVSHFSRGFDKDAMRDYTSVLAQWSIGKRSVMVPMQRLIGIGTAIGPRPVKRPSELLPFNHHTQLWDLRGRFVTGNRELSIRGADSKRQEMRPSDKPHLALIASPPNLNHDYDNIGVISALYTIDWSDNSDELQTDFTIAEQLEEIDFNEA